MTDSDVLDLDAAHAAAAEEVGDPIVVRLGGETYEVGRSLELPVDAMSTLNAGDGMPMTRFLFGADTDAVTAAGLSMQDLGRIVDTIVAQSGGVTASGG